MNPTAKYTIPNPEFTPEYDVYSAPAYEIPKSNPKPNEMAYRVKLKDGVRQYRSQKRFNRNLAWVSSEAARLSLNSSAGNDGDGRVTPSRSRLDCRRLKWALALKVSTKSVWSPLLLPTPAPITSSIHVAGL
ncbi:hypothetical protein PI125_g25322 [Phytophthora idaei]|nr:hypothetical protein PI125_g25322 [Phytophthora idaei]